MCTHIYMFSRRRRWNYLRITCIICLWAIPLFLLYAKDIQVVLSVKHNKSNGGELFQKKFNLDLDNGNSKNAVNDLAARDSVQDDGDNVLVDDLQAPSHDVFSVLNRHQESDFVEKKKKKKSTTIPQHVIGESRSSNGRQQQQTRLANYEKLVGNRDKRLPGELGQGVVVNGSVAEKAIERIGYERHAFNQLVSDRISLFRTLRDYRNQK